MGHDVAVQNQNLAPANTEAGLVSASERERYTLQAAFAMAKQFPRNEEVMYSKLMNACARPGFAEAARYVYPRGQSNISGPSVRLAREMARLWGHMRWGVRLVTIDDDYIHICGWAQDCDSGGFVEMEAKPKNLIYRKKGGWKKPDERDLRELINRHGAICVRNALLQLLPPDFVDDAMASCRETLVKAARNEIQQRPEEAVRRLVVAFGDLSITVEMLEGYLGHAVAQVDAAELTDLRGVYKSITDGHTNRKDHFTFGVQEEKEPEKKSSVTMDNLRKGEDPEPRDAKAEKKSTAKKKGGKKKENALSDEALAEVKAVEDEKRETAKTNDTDEPNEEEEAFMALEGWAQQVESKTQLEQVLSSKFKGVTCIQDLDPIDYPAAIDALREIVEG